MHIPFLETYTSKHTNRHTDHGAPHGQTHKHGIVQRMCSPLLDTGVPQDIQTFVTPTETSRHLDSPQLDTTQTPSCTWTPISLRTPRHLDTPTSGYTDARISLCWHTLILHILARGDPHLHTETQPTQIALHPNSKNLTLRYPETLASASPRTKAAGRLPTPHSEPATQSNQMARYPNRPHMSCALGYNHTTTIIHTHIHPTHSDCPDARIAPAHTSAALTPPAGVTTGSSSPRFPRAHKEPGQKLRPEEEPPLPEAGPSPPLPQTVSLTVGTQCVSPTAGPPAQRPGH